VVEGVEERVDPEVEGMVVGERHAVEAQQGEHFGGGRGRTEEERFGRVRPGPPAGGDAAFEVDDGEVPFSKRGYDLVGEEGGGCRPRQDVGDASPQHRVASEHELHRCLLPGDRCRTGGGR
jgi:hypothetical protein